MENKLDGIIRTWLPKAAELRRPAEAGIQVSPARQEGEEYAPVDLQTLAENLGDDAELAQVALDDFLAYSDDLLNRINKGVSGAEPEAIHREAHSLKGAALTICAHRLAQLCDELEQAGEKGDMVMATACASKLNEEYSRVRLFLVSLNRQKS